MAPVRGERAQAVMRLCPEMARPVSGLTAITRTLSGPSGSAPAGICWRRRYVASALPPGYFRYTSSESVVFSMLPLPRSMWYTVPVSAKAGSPLVASLAVCIVPLASAGSGPQPAHALQVRVLHAAVGLSELSHPARGPLSGVPSLDAGRGDRSAGGVGTRGRRARQHRGRAARRPGRSRGGRRRPPLRPAGKGGARHRGAGGAECCAVVQTVPPARRSLRGDGTVRGGSHVPSAQTRGRLAGRACGRRG